MKPTDDLKAEHEGVKRMLQILTQVCGLLEFEKEISKTDIAAILEFLTVFVDKCHHAKEEDLLFPAMQDAGVPKEGGPIGVMLGEHAEGRGYIKAMKGAFNQYQDGNIDPGRLIAENGFRYISLLEQHIEKENNVLFPLADKVLTEKKQKELLKGFEKIEAERIGPGKHEEFHHLLHGLAEFYLK